MAWSVNDLKKFVENIINKYQSANFNADNFFYSFNPQQRMYQSDLLGRFQARNTGKTGANTGLLENETILTKLAPFTKPVTLPVIAGNATKPSDFIYGLAARIDGESVIMVTKGQWYFFKNSVIDAPSVSRGNYYATEYLNYYKVLPNTATSMDLDYICDVTDAVWGFIEDGNGLPVYDPGSSVQPLWDNNSLAEITQRTLKILGVHYSSQDFENFGQSTILTGN